MAPLSDFEINHLSNLPVVEPDLPSPVESEESFAWKSTNETLVPGKEEGSSELAQSKEEPIIRTGEDVSKYLVDVRDDGDPAITFRSMVLGTLFAALGAALCQIYIFKPEISGPEYFHGDPGLKEHDSIPSDPFFTSSILGSSHVVASLVASTAAGGSSAVMNFAVQRAVELAALVQLYYDTRVSASTAVLATFSTACFGYGIVGILRPLSIYPSDMVYWGCPYSKASARDIVLRARILTHKSLALHFNTAVNTKKIKLFWTAFTGMFFYEVIPAWMFPTLNGINIVCLASQHAPAKTVDFITHLFGGASGNEGLGLLSVSFDWQYIGETFMTLPLVQQGMPTLSVPQPVYLRRGFGSANSWIGYILCYIAIMAIYYSNTWNSLAFPMLSSSIFSPNGSIYHQSAVFGHTFELNKTALAEVGLPALTGSNAWNNLTGNLAIGGLVAHVVLFWGHHITDSVKLARTKMQPDRHYQAMMRYSEAPFWWYLILMAFAFFAGLIVVLRGETTLPWWAYIFALVLGALVTPFSTIIVARMGSGVATKQLMKMVAGSINPGKPVANLYFSMWSHDVVASSIGLAGDMKMGQYLKIPPRAMFLTQVYGTILGAVVNYVVMVSVVDAQRETLLDPIGSNVWSGQAIQTANSAAIT
ncbi:hypothetical protein PC9H_008366 [Pleurotus ostreatus]|uniref:Oligopeptide transporter n=1 Tax=Pleurotus ostreatus TaxID=5322 RepID=A0A8H6ZR72_PLEOS|nr:uncharacterized protein PC9H_008366 [Pleurotus ostreatus]KAF7426004.1 hypothetical protein PC9H_008366 [Pleurotus ostreatus]